MSGVPIQRQIECVERELKMRLRVYPRRIAEQKMTRTFADEEIAAMQAVLETLRAVEAPQRL